MLIRTFIIVGVCALGLGACSYQTTPDPTLSSLDSEYMALAPKAEVDVNFARYEVDDPTGQPPGTVVVDTKNRLLFLVLPGKKAMRYGVAVGDEAYGWTGEAVVQRKAEWPKWMPPADMVARWPYLKPTSDAGGLPGGPKNPLGARALYLYSNGKDTLYRIHGTNEPEQIGQAVSSGCIRMRNIDVIDLYNRVPVGAKVIVE